MEQIQNYGSVTVDLSGSDSPATSVTKTATYDQAFLGEDFSDAKGKFRAKRKAKKLSKIADKQEVKQARVGGRQEARLARRTTRKTTRQDMRDSQQDRRQTRQDTRDTRNQDRKAKRAEAKESRMPEEEEELEEDVDTNTIDPEADYAESEDDGYGDSDNGDAYSEEEEDYSEEETDDYYGDSEQDSFAGEQSNFVSELTGDAKVSPMVDTICMKIEWNNEMISRLMAAKNKMASNGQDTSKVTDALGQKFDRVQQLENKLENFSGANGMPDAQKQRAVDQARTRARNMRMQSVIPPVLVEKMLNKGYSKSQIKNWWNTTGKNKIVKSSFVGTTDDFGRGKQTEESVDVAYWEAPVYDNNEAQPVSVELAPTDEKSSNFIGGGSISWKPILIGAVVGFVAIYAIRKYKLLK